MRIAFRPSSTKTSPRVSHNRNSPQSNNKMTKPIVPWIGGKRRLAKRILPLFGEHVSYVEPFCGGAALFFLKEPSKAEVLNDINGEVVNLYRVVQHHLDEFVRQFRWSLVSRELFSWLKATPEVILTDIQRAARFYYLQKLAFGGKVSGQTFGVVPQGAPRLNLTRMEEDLSMAHLRLARATIEHLPWDACIKRYDRPGALVYCDPPYWGTEGYGVEFGLEQYDMMAELARTMKGRMIISVNDIPEMRKAFDGLTIERTELAYTVGFKATAPMGELIIRNW